VKIASLRMRGIRCFEDTDGVSLSSGCNIFIGQNNSGKSTILKGISSWQLALDWSSPDMRPNSDLSNIELSLCNIEPSDVFEGNNQQNANALLIMSLKGDVNYNWQYVLKYGSSRGPVFRTDWPNNFIVPFSAKRKASAYEHSVNLGSQLSINGTFSNLYARIDRVASPGPSAHELYRKAVEDIVGVLITTRSSPNGKEAGYYFDDDNFVTLDRMGDGVAEIVALVVELSLAKKRVFVLEEPETNLHPRGLKALLNLIRESSISNQFIIATHSNVVVRELSAPDTKIFRVHRNGSRPSDPSVVTEVVSSASAHRAVLQELGYEFGDFDLHEGWLFLEESSAETAIREILIPWFVPTLKGRLRTFSAGGASNIEPSVAEFQRLVTFVHLEPVYKDRLWVRADGDSAGKAIIESLHSKFPYLAAPRAAAFVKEQFEMYYPVRFSDEVNAALSVHDRQQKRTAKATLLEKVIKWSKENESDAIAEWSVSAAEQIQLLKEIDETIRL